MASRQSRNIALEGALRMGVPRGHEGCLPKKDIASVWSVPSVVEYNPRLSQTPISTRNTEDPRDIDIFNQQYLADQDLRRIQEKNNLRRPMRDLATERQLFRGTFDLADERKAIAGDWGRQPIPSTRAPVVADWTPRSTRFDSVQTLGMR